MIKRLLSALILIGVLFSTAPYAKELDIWTCINKEDYNLQKEEIENLTPEDMKSILSQTEKNNAVPNFKEEFLLRLVKFNENPEVVNILLDAGANVNYNYNKNDTTPLVMASGMNKNIDVIKLLVSKGANINAKGYEGRTPLMRALANNHLDIARYLIEAGADVKAKDKDGNTALVYLLDRDEKVDAPDIVQKLIDGGVDVNASKCQIPLEYAHVCGLKETEKLLVKAGAKAKSSFDRLERIGLNCEKYSQITCTIWY